MGINKELTALRAVRSWIEIYKLEDENFPEILEKHIAEQEKQQAEKKHEYDSSNVKNGPHTRSRATLLQQHQQQQTSCSPKTLGSEMDPQQTNQVRPQHTEQICIAPTTMITATSASSTLTSGNTQSLNFKNTVEVSVIGQKFQERHHTSTHQLDIIVCQAILCLMYI